jgi:hypothetical protein
MLSFSIWSVLFVVAALGALFTANGIRFGRNVAREARRLWNEPSSTGESRSPHDLEGLPALVRRYLDVALRERRTPVRAVRLRHGGTFRTKVEQPWLPIRGEQYFSADPPGFVWWGRVRVMPGLWIDARDKSMAGKGSMRVMVASTWTLADVGGPEIDQGALLRLLAEMVWFPTALLDRQHVSWAPRDEASAQARLRVYGRDVYAMFHFGQDGLPQRVTANRYRDVDGKGVLTPWFGELRNFRAHDGLLVPHEVEVSWQLESGVFPYARFTLERIEFDRPEPF